MVTQLVFLFSFPPPTTTTTKPTRAQNEAAAALQAATTTPKHHHVEEEEENEEELINGENGTQDFSKDFDTDEHIKDPVEERRTLAERNERLQDQLKV